MTLSSPPSPEPQPNPWSRLDDLLLDLLDELCHHEYDSFLCADIDNNQVLNTRCEYNNEDSVPVRPQPPRRALKAYRVTIEPERYPSAFDWAATFRCAASCLVDQEAAVPLIRGYGYPHFKMSPCADTPRYSRFGGRDPQEDCLAGPNFHDDSGRISWAGEALIEHTATHWGCILADQTAPVDLRPNRSQAGQYLLRSELVACACLMRLQINETLWDVWEQKFRGWKLRTGNSLIKSTVISFEGSRVRVVQASYDPSSPNPSLVFTLHGSYALGAGAAATCSKKTTWAILWWILNPNGPSDSLISPTREEPDERLPTEKHRVPSPNGSAASSGSQKPTEGLSDSHDASVDASLS